MNMALSGIQRGEICGLVVVREERKSSREKLSLYLWGSLDVWALTFGWDNGGGIYKVVFQVLNSGDPPLELVFVEGFLVA